ncbi:MAG: helix-turn-helix domain-containing protein [Bdellovibrio sp.]
MDQLNQHADSKKLLKTLREVLKSKRITYALLAKKLGVSEVTIKRLFSTQNCNLQMIFKICDSIGISFFDLASLANQDEEIDYALTTEQEIFFANPAFFGIFRSLHRGMSSDAIAEHWQLTPRRLFRVLRKLEKLDLLEVLPQNKVRMKVIGNIRFQHLGPLARKILRPQIMQFLDHIDVVLKNKDVCMHSAEVELSTMHISEFVEEIHALGAKYRARALRDKNLISSEKLKSVRWLFAFAPYETNWQQYELRE